MGSCSTTGVGGGAAAAPLGKTQIEACASGKPPRVAMLPSGAAEGVPSVETLSETLTEEGGIYSPISIMTESGSRPSPLPPPSPAAPASAQSSASSAQSSASSAPPPSTLPQL